MAGGESSVVAPRGIKDPRTIARKYQLELCKKAVEENIIVYLGTGCGKTHIAVLLMYELGHLIRKPSKTVCIFLAPTIPLVRQQAVVIENSTDFKVHCYYGNRKNLKDHNAWNQEINKAEVLVMTPQILLHSLHHCFIKMDLVALLIFDECHHAQAHKRHAYAQIMKEFYNTSIKSPRIFGMTASPIIGKGATNQLFSSKCVNSLENLLDAKVHSVDDKSELESFVASPDVKVYYYDPVFHMASSITVGQSDKLEEIKLQCISMIKDMFSDVRECQKKIKVLSRLHDDIIFCLNQIGLVGALEALKATHGLLASEMTDLSELERVKINGDSCHIQQYLSKAKAVLRSNLLADDHDVDSLHCEAIKDPFYSKKLILLIKILSSYSRLQESLKCIVFVKRIIIAKTLANILQGLQSLEFLKCEFLVGCHSGANMSRGKMNAIVEKFSSGKVNLLVATNVAEEGLDIQTCCLVVRFDLPETVASFIQSRGRARMTTSEYVFLVERGNEREEKILCDFVAGERIMNTEISNKTSNKTFDYSEEIIYKVDSTGASISTGCSVSLLHRYCDKLPRDTYFTPTPIFFYIDDLDGTICRIILPPNSPIRQVDSLPCTSKDEAKRIACLKACKELHKQGALTNYLLPVSTAEEKNGSQNHLSGNNNNNNEDESSSQELYEMLLPAALRCSWKCYDAKIDMYFYYIQLVPMPNDRRYRMFGLFIGSLLPEEAENLEVDLHLNRGRIVNTKFVSQGIVTFDKEEIVLAQKFQEMFLKIIFDRSEYSSDFVPLGILNETHAVSSNSYLLLPVTEQIMIDWTSIRRCLSSQTFTNRTSAFDKVSYCNDDILQLFNGPVNKTDVLNSLVFTPHNNLFFFIDGIHYGTNGNSPYKNTSYAEYYRDRFKIKLSYPEQPFLKAKQLFVVRNLLHNRVKQNTEARVSDEHFVQLPPELCSLKIIGFSKDIGSTLSLLPSLMHRLQNLLVAIELKNALSSSFPEASEVRASCILEALTTEKCLERFSLERFEVLGDSFLKYAVARQSFVSYEALNEGQLTRRRSAVVNNLNLYELAIAQNLQVYIHDDSFNPSQFFALGRPCKQFCNTDTESIIHRQGVNENSGDERRNIKCTKSHQWLQRKTIADVVEALIGAFLVESGFKAAIAFLRWIGIPVDFDVSNVYRICDSSNNNLSLMSNINVKGLEGELGYSFHFKGLLLEAFVHPSYSKHSGGCYQKLEFLGDAVLDYLITSYLYSVYPELKPGQITDLRSLAVNNYSLANVAVQRSLHKYLIQDSKVLAEAVHEFENFVLLSDLEKDLIEEPACPKVLGDIVESSVGAVLLDTGFNLKIAWDLMRNLLQSALDFSSFQINPTRELRELCQHLVFVLGLPDPIKIPEGYLVKVEIDINDVRLTFKSSNKNSKAARRMASLEALSVLKARGYKHRSKTLKDVLRSTKRGEARLIGFDEEPIVMDNLEHGLEKVQIQNSGDTLQSSDSGRGNDPLECSVNSKSSRVDLAEARITESCNTSNVKTSESSANEKHANTVGQSVQKTAKSRLMEICAASYWNPPLFECCREEGPSHLKMFTYKVIVEVAGTEHLECFGDPKPQKKAAQDHAAEGALWYLKRTGYIH